jgi:hypothetical protein
LNIKKTKTKPKNILTMHGPAVYRIHVRGRLDPKYSDRLAGMQLTEICGSNGTPETILVGRLMDQASLSGLLESLYAMHLPVLSADCIDVEKQG